MFFVRVVVYVCLCVWPIFLYFSFFKVGRFNTKDPPEIGGGRKSYICKEKIKKKFPIRYRADEFPWVTLYYTNFFLAECIIRHTSDREQWTCFWLLNASGEYEPITNSLWGPIFFYLFFFFFACFFNEANIHRFLSHQKYDIWGTSGVHSNIHKFRISA